jgi:hypothetical protein
MMKIEDTINACAKHPQAPGSAITVEELKVICDATVRLVEIRQRECAHLCIENIGPEIMHKLLTRLQHLQAPSSRISRLRDGLQNIAECAQGEVSNGQAIVLMREIAKQTLKADDIRALTPKLNHE